jgi:hypothetical protein
VDRLTQIMVFACACLTLLYMYNRGTHRGGQQKVPPLADA